MKTIYKVLYPLGYEEHEVADDFPTSIPFVEVEPIQNLENPQSQFFNFAENKWEQAVTPNYAEKLELIETLTETVQKENEFLKEKAEVQENQLTETQLALAEVYEMLVPADREVNQMANIYVNLIQKGLKAIEDVPQIIREEVEAILSAKTADQDCFLFY